MDLQYCSRFHEVGFSVKNSTVNNMLILLMWAVCVPFVLLFLLVYCAIGFYKYKKHKTSEFEPLSVWSNGIRYSTVKLDRLGVFLIKRCDQETTRTVENSIIYKQSNLRRYKLQDWSPNLDGQNPVVVFCVISSRIGTDIDSAMRGVITNGNSVILVLLHFQNKSQLRGDLSDNEHLLDDKTKDRFVGIAHFAFSEQENLYSCAQNTQGITKLNELISLAARSP